MRKATKTMRSIHYSFSLFFSTLFVAHINVCLTTQSGTPKLKKGKNLSFSHKPLEIFEYPREDDYESSAELTSDEYDEEDEDGGHTGEARASSEDDNEEVVEDDEVVEKEVEEYPLITSSLSSFIPLSTLPLLSSPSPLPLLSLSSPSPLPLLSLSSPSWSLLPTLHL